MIFSKNDITPQDVVKRCFQAVFGAEHFFSAEKSHAMERYFYKEWDALNTPAATPPLEELTETTARVNMASWKQKNLPPKWLFELFAISAQSPPNQPEAHFFSLLEQAKNLCAESFFLFAVTEWDAYIQQYNASLTNNKPQAVHHSQAYRDKYRPAYRVVNGNAAKAAKILSRVQTHTTPVIIAIDGRAGAGKTTLAQLLNKTANAPVINMDDFFLPPELRTDERLAQPGGNIHHERFAQEVLPHLRTGQPFKYKAFDCQTGGYTEKKHPQSHITIVEGSYSFHPTFKKYADLYVFCDITADEQLSRITARNGAEAAQRFKDVWIPMEEQYFAAFDIANAADLVISNQ